MIPHGLTDNQRKTPPHWPALCTRTLPHRSRPLARPCFAAEVCLELLLRQQATIERFPNLGLDHVGSDENDLSAPIAETVVLVLLGLGWPLLRRHSHHQPPAGGTNGARVGKMSMWGWFSPRRLGPGLRSAVRPAELHSTALSGLPADHAKPLERSTPGKE